MATQRVKAGTVATAVRSKPTKKAIQHTKMDPLVRDLTRRKHSIALSRATRVDIAKQTPATRKKAARMASISAHSAQRANKRLERGTSGGPRRKKKK